MEKQTAGDDIKRAQITVKGKTVEVAAGTERMGLRFKNDFGIGVIIIDTADISLDTHKNETYLNTGPMLFGPLDAAAAKTMAALIAPVITH